MWKEKEQQNNRNNILCNRKSHKFVSVMAKCKMRLNCTNEYFNKRKHFDHEETNQNCNYMRIKWALRQVANIMKFIGKLKQKKKKTIQSRLFDLWSYLYRLMIAFETDDHCIDVSHFNSRIHLNMFLLWKTRKIHDCERAFDVSFIMFYQSAMKRIRNLFIFLFV